MARLLISATRKSSGKTALTLGLCVALRERGLSIQAFKKGPDYIDPLWLSAATDRPCLNLDFRTMTSDEILATFGHYIRGAAVGLVEGNKGLHDGMDLHGTDSNAALAHLLQAPVLLVVDVEGMTRGVAPILNGFQSFDPSIRFAGVVLNNYHGERHLDKLAAAVHHYTDLTILGAVPRTADVQIVERHLGLTTRAETTDADLRLQRLGALIRDHVELDNVLACAHKAPAVEVPRFRRTASQLGRGIRIGIARDSAFCFYYPDDLDEMRRQGARLCFFDTLSDGRLPDVDVLFMGGGFPETHAQALAQNSALQADIRQFVDRGGFVYAECGGLMYLTQAISWEGNRYPMVGVIPAEVIVETRPVGRGYVMLERTQQHPWGAQGVFQAHEFHYSRLVGLSDMFRFGFRVRRGYGIDGVHDGLVMGNLFASYAHQRHTRQNPWVTDFLGWAQRAKTGPLTTHCGSRRQTA